MPDRHRVEDLIRHVEAGRFVESLKEFYHPDAVMQENSDPPRIGLAASLKRQRMAQASTLAIHGVKAASVMIEGDRAALEWHAEWTMTGGARLHVEEVALQQWRGDRIIHERFFYDTSAIRAAMGVTQ